MEPRLEQLPEKTLVGMHLRMSLAQDRTPELWRSFMPRRKEIAGAVGPDLISMQVYDPGFDIAQLTLETPFTKWAAVEVSPAEGIPAGMERFALPRGLYAVFTHRGPASDGPRVFGHIYGTWLPASGYAFDARPQFEVLGAKYKNNDPDSEEEIWIPVRPKGAANP